MAIFKRDRLWWVRFTAPSGERVRLSTGTEDRQEAQEYHDQLKAELWRIHKLGDSPKHTWQEAVVRWVREKEHKSDRDKDIQKLRWFDQHPRWIHIESDYP